MSYGIRQRNDSEVVLMRERLIAAETQRDKDSINQKYKNKNAIDEAGYFSCLFFSWVNPILNHSKKFQMDINELGTVRPEDDVRQQKLNLQERWYFYRESDKEHKLYWAVLSAYKWEFTVAIFWNNVIAALQLSTPFLLRRLIVFI